MIIDSFDPNSKQLINPKDAISSKTKQVASYYEINTIIMVFSSQLIDELKERKIIEIIDENLCFGSAAYKSPIYRIVGTKIGVFLSGIGTMMSVGMIEELHAAFNTKNFIVFGSCGALVDIPEGRLIVPNYAYRDEGTSYHYAEASDYIKIRNTNKLSKLFDELKVEYVVGKTWTTDGFYRETENNRDKRIKEGCICVEMECSALQAVCNFRGLELYQFIYAADSLNGTWSRRILGNLEIDVRLAYFKLAEKIAERI